MHYGFETLVLTQSGELPGFRKTEFSKPLRIHIVTVAVRKIIDHRNFVLTAKQVVNGVRTYVTRSAGN